MSDIDLTDNVKVGRLLTENPNLNVDERIVNVIKILHSTLDQ